MPFAGPGVAMRRSFAWCVMTVLLLLPATSARLRTVSDQSAAAHALWSQALGSGDAGNVSMAQHGILCFLKQQLQQFYTLRQVPAPLRDGKSHCAVVSNSGAMLAHGSGADIDHHDVVIRLNDAPTVGFEPHVGQRTTFRFGWNTCTGPASCKTDTAIPDAPALWPISFGKLYPACVKEPHQFALSAMYSAGTVNGSADETHNPTTGFYAMLLALSHCASVDAYEMAPSDAAKRSSYSYYREGNPGDALRVSQEHRLVPLEHDLWARLSIAGEAARRNVGKTSYPGFGQVACPVAQLPAPSLTPEIDRP